MADDHELWERIRERDANAFEVFYRDNATALCAYLRQIVGNTQAAEDAMQETFTQIWKSPNGFRPELGSLRGYLFGIGRKRAADIQRRLEDLRRASCEGRMKRPRRLWRGRRHLRDHRWHLYCGGAAGPADRRPQRTRRGNGSPRARGRRAGRALAAVRHQADH